MQFLQGWGDVQTREMFGAVRDLVAFWPTRRNQPDDRRTHIDYQRTFGAVWRNAGSHVGLDGSGAGLPRTTSPAEAHGATDFPSDRRPLVFTAITR